MALPFGAHVPFATQNPSPLSFGFGLGVPQHHLPPPEDPSSSTSASFATQFAPQTPQAAAAATATPQRPPIPPRTSTKRRAEFDENEDDAAMMGDGARSPSPSDRPMRRIGGMKKLRMTPAAVKVEGKIEEDDVDVGSLLASLPSSSHLPLLTALINERPELKQVVLSLIPRPTLDTAVQAINAGAKKLRDAYPYSVPAPTWPGSLGFGFGSSTASQPAPSNPMRDSYVRTRLRQPVKEFSKLLLSYMSYFSSTPAEQPPSTPGPSNSAGSVQPSQRQPAVPLHPTETFTFLQNVTSHVLRMPPLTIAELTRPADNVVFPRLVAEWSAWVTQIDRDVNHMGKMHRDEVVKGWERGLDELVEVEEQMLRSLQQHQQSSNGEGSSNGNVSIGMRGIRDRWVQQVGWMIGRRAGSIGMEM
ncbi:hypothetical protein FRC00_004076 [Tulasnella sp. 408]|nr:hypothetical protein FRC00_004076 [Tulasnella sp. 408]